jgi:hypothetical protein
VLLEKEPRAEAGCPILTEHQSDSPRQNRISHGLKFDPTHMLVHINALGNDNH